MKREFQPLDFLVDDLTNLIKNRISGDSFQTEVAQKLVDHYFKN